MSSASLGAYTVQQGILTGFSYLQLNAREWKEIKYAVTKWNQFHQNLFSPFDSEAGKETLKRLCLVYVAIGPLSAMEVSSKYLEFQNMRSWEKWMRTWLSLVELGYLWDGHQI